MDMDISFTEKTVKNTVYLKMDAYDQLLLSEGVCRQLGIVTYHPSVLAQETEGKQHEDARVPTIRVNLVKFVCLPPRHSALG